MFLVALMGFLGGALSASVFIRGLYLNNATPYNVAVPLALSKLPAGAMTSVLGMILLAGDFVPGFSAVAESLVASVPTKARSESKVAGRADGVEFALVEYASGRDGP